MNKRPFIVVLAVVCILIIGGWLFISRKIEDSGNVQSTKRFESKELGIAFKYPVGWGNATVTNDTNTYFSITFSGAEINHNIPSISGSSSNYQYDEGFGLYCGNMKDREVKPGVFLSYRMVTLGEAVPMGVIYTNISKNYPNICASVDLSNFLYLFTSGWNGFFTTNDFNEGNLKKLISSEQDTINGFEQFAQTLSSY